MKAAAFFAAVIGAVLLVILVLTLTKPFSSSKPAPVNPLCTVTAVNQLANYWNQRVADASYSQLQNVYFEAEQATDARLNYCKAHS